MNAERITELEIKLAYQEDLLQALNQVVADQQKQISKLHETCLMLNDKINSLGRSNRPSEIIEERPPHY